MRAAGRISRHRRRVARKLRRAVCIARHGHHKPEEVVDQVSFNWRYPERPKASGKHLECAHCHTWLP
jgi:hypothetical protein